MGKRIIIKGANFLQNALDENLIEAALFQGYVINNPNNANYGKMNLERVGADAIFDNNMLCKILIPAGKSAYVYIYDSIGEIVEDLNIGFVASETNYNITPNTIVTNIVAHQYPNAGTYRQADGSQLITNDSSNDLYYYINISYSNSGPAIQASTKICKYKLQDDVSQSN